MEDLLSGTIAQVAAGSISASTTKLIANKQMSMIRNAQLQEKFYQKLQKIKAKTDLIKNKQFPSTQLSNNHHLEASRNTNNAIDHIQSKATTVNNNNNYDSRPSTSTSTSTSAAARTTAINQHQHLNPTMIVKPKRFRRTKLQMMQDKARAAEKTARDLMLKRTSSGIDAGCSSSGLKKREAMKTVPIKEETDWTDVSIRSLKLDGGHDDDDYDYDEKPKRQQQQQRHEEKILRRQCLVCKKKMHQDELNAHYTEHFSTTPSCCNCHKVSPNAAAYVTHILSHLRKRN